jgi:ABC-type dipeptide/oligopeptide/nickel transport system permease component
MARYIISRIGQAIVVVFGISISVFLILRLSTGDPAKIATPVFARQDVLEQYRQLFGTNRPLFDQLSTFLSGLLHGNLGTSFRYQAPVTELILQRIGATLILALVSVVIAMILAVSLGVFSARHPRSPIATFAGALSTFGQAAPAFWIGLVLVTFLSVRWGLLPAGGSSDGWRSLLLPSFTIALTTLPTWLRVLRANMREVLGQDYVVAARAAGISERRIVNVYALRNAALPLITVVGVDLGYILGGVIVVETVFNYGGIGSLALSSFTARDYPLIQGLTIVTAAAFVLTNLLVDLTYGVIDPRVRVSGRQ